MQTEKINLDLNQSKIVALFGIYDKNIEIIETRLNVILVLRNEVIEIRGNAKNTNKAKIVLKNLISIIKKGNGISEQTINYLIDSLEERDIEKVKDLSSNTICMTISGKPVVPKTLGQQKYIEKIKNNTIVFGVGPAGTGKTYLAMAMAITAFKNNEVNRIILTRPAIEAGEKLGFLPGDLQQKVDPYLRPLYDALHEIMGSETFQKNMENGLIEVAPLAYMRGRTLDNAFIVLDEAQNTTCEQMKMFLTRIGFGSKAIITGDVTQKDLLENKKSGLEHATNILNDVKGVEICNLTNKDVVRHPLVQRIIKAYEENEQKDSRGNKKREIKKRI